jgi:hypothetical protein
MKGRLCGVVFLLALGAVGQSNRITARQAKDHIGETVTVCGKAVSTRYAPRSKGEPTFLNLDEPYPNEIFTILIWGENRSKFGAPESKYGDAKVCVAGKIISHGGIPEIVATEPDQIVEQK